MVLPGVRNHSKAHECCCSESSEMTNVFFQKFNLHSFLSKSMSLITTEGLGTRDRRPVVGQSQRGFVKSVFRLADLRQRRKRSLQMTTPAHTAKATRAYRKTTDDCTSAAVSRTSNRGTDSRGRFPEPVGLLLTDNAGNNWPALLPDVQRTRTQRSS
jgi:hypothetical protein